MKPFNAIPMLSKPAFLFGLLFGAASAHSAIQISNVPLQTGSAVPPNVMFIIDDSGSMHWEITPDEFRGSAYYMFPRANGVYGADDYTNTVVSFRDESSTAAAERNFVATMRSFEVNKSYYNPEITYRPWVRADGSSFPPAPPAAAPHHPIRNVGTRNLTADNSQSATWVTCTVGASGSSSCSTSSQTRTFFPAVYFQYNGGNRFARASYTKVEIRPTTTSYSGGGRTNRTDCTGGVCTYAQEIQNFANWYTYYRSRMLASQGGIGRAFVSQSERMRVGFGSLNAASTNVDGVSTRTIIRGVRPFSGSDKDDFYSRLYTSNWPTSNTPLRRALDDAGRYFSRTDSRGPWGLNPGSGTEPTLDHITCRQSFTILMTDGYWNDAEATTAGARANVDGSTGPLITGPNNLSFQYQPRSPFSDGHSNTLADVAMYYWNRDLRPDLENRVPTSTINPAFWQHMVTFGVGLGVTGSVSPTTAFNAISNLASVTWNNPTTNAAKLDDLLHAAVNGRGGFFTADNPDDFARRLEATLRAIQDRVASASNLAGTTTSTQADNFVFQGSFNSGEWSGALKAFNIDDTVVPVWEANFPAWDSRNIFFGKRNNAGAAAFTTANVNADGNALSGNGDLIDYLRGDQTKEEGESAQFRKRVSILGDIANSSPLYLANPVNRNFQRYNWTGASSYRDFLAEQQNRQPVVYVGANDGMLHGFNATNGTEIMAYVPASVLTPAANLADYASTEYEHRYFVDGSPVAFDVYLGGSWKTILIGSLGRGGTGLFAIDVTSPTALASANAAELVLWDKSFPELGITTSKPVVARLNNNKWAVVVGYGYNNSVNKAGLLVIDLETGEVLRKLDAGTALNNGTGQVEGWDANGDGITDWFFVGDLQGNIWKFDLSSNTAASWAVAYGGDPLFVATDKNGVRQPVTGGLTLSSDPKTGYLWVNFGTGRMLSEEDPLTSSLNTWYGIRDGSKITSRSELQERKILGEQNNARVIELGAPNDMTTKRGWFIDLGDQRERIVNRPQLVGNAMVVNTIIPGDNLCNPQGSGWVMSVDPYTGSRLRYNFFDRNNDGIFDGNDSISIPGVNNGELNVVSAIRFDGMPSEPVFFDNKMIVGLADTRIADVDVDLEFLRGRVSWRELSNP